MKGEKQVQVSQDETVDRWRVFATWPVQAPRTIEKKPSVTTSRSCQQAGRVYGTRKNLPQCRVELAITNHYPIIDHFFRSLSSVLHFEGFKMLWECYLKLTSQVPLFGSSPPPGALRYTRRAIVLSYPSPQGTFH